MRLLLILLLTLNLQPLYAEVNLEIERDKQVMRGFFDAYDLAADNEAQKLTVIRRITLYKTAPEVRRTVSLPGLAEILLNPENSERIRRAAAKAIFTISGEKKMARAFVPLLEQNEITLEATLEAIWYAIDPVFVSGLVNLSLSSHIDEALRRTALLTTLALWQANDCQLELNKALSLATIGPPSSDSADATKVYQALWAIYRQQKPKLESIQQIKALLLLGCFGDERAVTEMLKIFPHIDSSQKLYIARIIGHLDNERSLSTLENCVRRGPEVLLQKTCIRSMARMDSAGARARLLAIYPSLAIALRQEIVEATSLTSHEGRLLQQLKAIEKTKKLKSEIRFREKTLQQKNKNQVDPFSDLSSE